MLSGVAKILYDDIVGQSTLEEQQAKYRKYLIENEKHARLQKEKIDTELIANGYQGVIIAT